MNLLHFLFRQVAWQEARIQHLEERQHLMSADQSHLDQDVDALKTGFAQVVQELKDQAATGTPLDFTNADKLVADVQAEATADAPAPVDQPTDTPPAA